MANTIYRKIYKLTVEKQQKDSVSHASMNIFNCTPTVYWITEHFLAWSYGEC
jgi:hypothetical protein